MIKPLTRFAVAVVILAVFSLTLLSSESNAGTRVHVGVALGGVIILGGGVYLMWDIGVSERIAAREAEAERVARGVNDDDGSKEATSVVAKPVVGTGAEFDYAFVTPGTDNLELTLPEDTQFYLPIVNVRF